MEANVAVHVNPNVKILNHHPALARNPMPPVKT